jgi:hypothetical protein
LRQLVDALELVADERISGIRAFQHRAEREFGIEFHRHVFQRVHGDVGAAVEHCDFELLEEQTLAADLGKRAVEDQVAARAQRDQLDCKAG